jgi:DNA-binding transcriptional ArsR family regulator
VPSRLPADRLEAIEALRRLRMTAAEIAEVLGMALSTVSRWLRRIGPGKRSALAPPEPPNRYERKRPGELIHVDIKELARISARGAGHRVTGNRKSQFELGSGAERSRKTGWEFVHVCVDDATRLAYGAIYGSSAERTAALPGWLDHYNFRRRHGSLGHKAPAAGSPSWNNVMGTTASRTAADRGGAVPCAAPAFPGSPRGRSP